MAKTKTPLTVSRDKAVALLTQLGAKGAAKMDDAKLLGKLTSLDDSDDDADPGKYRKTFEKIVAANAKGQDIELEGGAPAKKTKEKAESNGKAAKGKNKEKAAKAKKKGGGVAGRSSATIFGHSATSVAHWMGANGMNSEQAKKVASKFMKGEVSESTIRQAVTDGRGGVYGRSAELSKEEISKIKSLVKGKA